LAILGAVAWGSMPVIWVHATYSMLSTGIALLPFYFLAVLHLFSIEIDGREVFKTGRINKASAYLIVCLIAIFMDGYSFMMFAVGSGFLGLCSYIKGDNERRGALLRFSLPVYLLGLGLAYAMYTLYVGKPQFDSAPMDFFRGWGVDLTFLAVPTQGIHWIPDVIGLSVPRSKEIFFGDSSVWTTSFCLPVLLGAIWAFRGLSGRKKTAFGFAVVAVFGMYMSLGPSLKINSVEAPAKPDMQFMPEEYAIAPTGSAILSRALPGFKNMRASYRWLALGVFGSWTLLVMVLSEKNRKYVAGATIFLGVVVLLNLPNIPEKLGNNIRDREGFLSLESDLIDDMAKVLSPGEKVAFLPWRNDFLVNYAAAKLKIVTYNIGGDKNLAEARLHWPRTMRQFPMASIGPDFASRVLLLLARKEADVVVLPYIDTLWAAHGWPYPNEFEAELSPVLNKLSQSGLVTIDNRKYYAVVKLKTTLLPLAGTKKFEEAIAKRDCIPPYCLKRDGFRALENSLVGVLQDGRLQSNGKAGFLHFGPYASMEKGVYQLTVRGTAEATDSAWVDVASGKGAVIHGRFKLLTVPSGREQILASGRVKLDSSVDDLEVRVYVGTQDKVALRGYSLEPIAK